MFKADNVLNRLIHSLLPTFWTYVIDVREIMLPYTVLDFL